VIELPLYAARTDQLLLASEEIDFSDTVLNHAGQEGGEMKSVLKLCVVVAVLLLALTTCNLNQISVGWVVNGLSEPLSNFVFVIDYDVWNVGKYDLDGVKLHFSIYLSGVGYYEAVTPEFSLSKNQYIAGNTLAVSLPYHIAGSDFAEVVGVDMAKPSD
jgi:hypothetical protein